METPKKVICRNCSKPISMRKITINETESKLTYTHRAVGTCSRVDPLMVNSSKEFFHCDFCFDKPALWSYNCDDFSLPVSFAIHYDSSGWWAACEDCKMDIEERDWESILKRTFRKILPSESLETSSKARLLKSFYSSFAENVVGSPLRNSIMSI